MAGLKGKRGAADGKDGRRRRKKNGFFLRLGRCRYTSQADGFRKMFFNPRRRRSPSRYVPKGEAGETDPGNYDPGKTEK